VGIDLLLDGITANDANDPDAGPNNVQNFPIIISAVTGVGGSVVAGTINTNPNTSITVHVYGGPSVPDPEGRDFLGLTTVMTDGSGNANWSVTGAVSTVGFAATATAASADGSSEFSAAVTFNAAPTVEFSQATFSVNETAGTATITVTRSGDLTGVSTVQYATSDNTALDGSDYNTASGTLTFIAGDSSETFDVTIVNDTLDELLETLNLTLSSPIGAALGAQSGATLEITDDDAPPTISIDDVALATISLSTASGQQVQVTYATNDGSAAAGSDYTTTGGRRRSRSQSR